MRRTLSTTDQVSGAQASNRKGVMSTLSTTGLVPEQWHGWGSPVLAPLVCLSSGPPEGPKGPGPGWWLVLGEGVGALCEGGSQLFWLKIEAFTQPLMST